MTTAKPYPLAEIVRIIGANLFGGSSEGFHVGRLLTDSRQLVSPVDTLFFALRTKKNDGHRFIGLLADQGVRCFVVEKLPSDVILTKSDCRFLLVNNSLDALQQLAAHHRSTFGATVIGITGSNGKTIVKEWLHQLLAPDFSVVRSPKSYNSQTGVPLSVWQIEPANTLAIFEAGISEPGEMELLEKMIRPNIGLLTNIGPAHGENFKNIEQKTDEKLRLFTHANTLIYCADQPFVRQAISRVGLDHQSRLFSWSRTTAQADVFVFDIEKQAHQTRFSVEAKGQRFCFSIPFTDEAAVENALHCVAIIVLLGYTAETISRRMPHLTSVAMRLELKEGLNNCTLVNDSYNSDLHSLSIALDFLKQQNQHPSLTLILSDILESGIEEPELYLEVAALVQAKGIRQIIGIGPALMRQSALFDVEDKAFFATTEAFLQSPSSIVFRDSSILIKGARVFGFERISQLLQQKAHETVLEVNLNNLISNLNYYKSLLPEKVKLMVMVKAFSYGSGSYEIANALQFHHVDYLTVAYADEGIELRKAGIRLPIMVMSPEEHSFDAMLANELEPEIFSFRTLSLLEEALGRIVEGSRKVKIHLKLDTGMHRLGFDTQPEELQQLARHIAANDRLQVATVFSHLAASEDPSHDTFTRQQINQFCDACTLLKDELGYSFDRHILNSAGIVRFPEAACEMVRLGIGIYGAAPESNRKLAHVLSLRSTLSQIRLVAAGHTVGYGRHGIVQAETRIGVVPVGYADGLPRSLSNGKGYLFVKGQKVPIVGDVCMDMCMVDLNGVEAAEGEEVVVFDSRESLMSLAQAAHTIPYEILTRISRRVKRVYYQE